MDLNEKAEEFRLDCKKRSQKLPQPWRRYSVSYLCISSLHLQNKFKHQCLLFYWRPSVFFLLCNILKKCNSVRIKSINIHKYYLLRFLFGHSGSHRGTCNSMQFSKIEFKKEYSKVNSYSVKIFHKTLPGKTICRCFAALYY